MTYQHLSFAPCDIERLLHHMPAVACQAENEWAGGFAKSIIKQSRRRHWKPTPKQLSIMQRLVADLFSHGVVADDLEVLE
ncbi:MAG: hypothetical protein AAF755_00100 [Pseudomonadota bacterium]